MTGVPGSASAPGARPPAPGGLALVQAFVNTEDIEAGSDTLASPAALAEWLATAGLPGGMSLEQRDLARAHELRNALRSSLEANAHRVSPHDNQPGDRLTLAGRSIPLRVAGSPEGPVLQPAGSGIDVALGIILAAAVTATADGSWARLKVCRNDACRWAYWDTSRNRSGVWCTMAVCGNRAKGRAFRRRARSTAT